jgi:hypothetical protein
VEEERPKRRPGPRRRPEVPPGVELLPLPAEAPAIDRTRKGVR